MLGEIHVSLLRSIIRDIEDVARTPFSGIGNNQYTTANPEGGHPQIVEGVTNFLYLCMLISFSLSGLVRWGFIFPVLPFLQAYAWGFDIHSWKKHVNPLTWPEILRQLALSTGFGPRLKKKNSRLTHAGDKDEVLLSSHFCVL